MSSYPTEYEMMLEAMADAAWRTIVRDEGSWIDAIVEALFTAKRDHSSALGCFYFRRIHDIGEG